MNHNLTISDVTKEVTISFKKLTKYLDKFDPLKLISQMTLTYLFYPAIPGKEFKPEYDDIFKHSRYIEFISGYFLKSKYPKEKEAFIDGKVLDKIEELSEKYFFNFSRYHSFPIHQDIVPSRYSLLFSLKLNSTFVRGDTFPSLQIKQASDLYSYHDDYFKKTFGFTIEEAIEIYISIENEMVERINNTIKVSREEATKLTKSQIAKKPNLIENKEEISISNFYKLFFLLSDVHLSFTIEQMVDFTGKNIEKCTCFLQRFSQPFGYQNPEFREPFKDALKAGLDYNTLYEKPIIAYSNKYFIPIISIFPEVLLNTFHYDIIRDNSYKDIYNDKRGKWLENRTYKVLKSVFQKDVMINPFYPNKEELSDILVFFDRKIIIIQCKSKSLTMKSKIGESFDSLKDDIKKGVEDAQNQAIKAKEYFLNNENPIVIYKNRSITIDMNQVSDIFILCVTFGYYKSLLTKISDINDTLDLFRSNNLFWAISISDLEIITEIITKPYEFIHYFKKRQNVENEKFNISADEVDLLNVYLSQGLNFKITDFKEYNSVYLNSFSNDVDEYYYNKYVLKQIVEKPKRKYPEKLIMLIDEIEKLQTPYFSDCIDKILLLDFRQQEGLMKGIFKICDSKLKANKIKTVHIHNEKYEVGISYVLCNVEKDIEKIYQQVQSIAILYKYKFKCNSWVGLAKDEASSNLVDVAFYLSFPWIEDEMIERKVKEHNNEVKTLS